MGRKRIKGLATVLLSLLAGLLMPASILAFGVGVGPSSIKIESAVRGNIYEQAIAVFNMGADEADFSLTADGDIPGWVSFYTLDDRDTAIDRITVPGNDKLWVLVKFAVPADATKTVYQGNLYVTGEDTRNPEEQMGNLVGLQMPVDVTIEIAGTLLMEGNVTGISAEDTELGLPVNIQVGFANTGAVPVQPKISVKITNSGSLVAEFTVDATKVESGKQEVIKVPWDTKGQREGSYSADVQVSLGDKVLDTRQASFRLLPAAPSTAQAAGAVVIHAFSSDGQPALGMNKIQALVHNSGPTDSMAKFIGEVYRDGKLVDTIQSDEVLIPAGKSEKLNLHLKVESPGKYEINGYVNYEGKRSEVKELVFIIPESQAQGSPATAGGPAAGTNNVPILAAGGLIALGLAIFAVTKLNQRRQLAVNSRRKGGSR